MNQAAQQAILAGQQRFVQPKPEGDIDLVLEVRNILQSAGLLQNVLHAYDNHRFVIDAAGKCSDVQRFMLNRYWNLQLSMSPNSIDVRYNLIPNGTINDWLRLFRDSILPFLIQNGLPKQIPGPV